MHVSVAASEENSASTTCNNDCEVGAAIKSSTGEAECQKLTNDCPEVNHLRKRRHQ